MALGSRQWLGSSTTASVVSTASNPGAGRRAHRLKSEEHRKKREADRKNEREQRVEGFVMRQTSDNKLQSQANGKSGKSSLVSSGLSRYNAGGLNSLCDSGKTFDGWEQTPSLSWRVGKWGRC